MAKARKNIFEELNKVKKLVYLFFPEISARDLCKLLGTYHYNKRKFIVLGKEKSLYNQLIENSFNPFTVYRWALLERAPDDIKF